MGNRGRRRSERPSEQEAIDAIDRFPLTADHVLQEMALLACSDIGELFDAAGHLKPVAQWSEDAAAAVASVDVTRYASPGGGPPGLRVKVRLWDKLKALELLCKHF